MYTRSDALVKNKFREFLLPSILMSMAVSLANVVDSLIVGQLLGPEALAAVGLSAPIIYGINLLVLLFSVGGVTCASIAMGKRENEAANQFFTLSLFAGSGLLLLFALVMLALAGPATAFLTQGNAQLQALTQAYVQPVLFVGPALMFSLGVANFIRAEGDPKTSAMVILVANAVNLVLDYVLIRFAGLGVAGAGLSTTLGYVVGCFLVLPYLFSKQRAFRFARIGKDVLARLGDILRIGLPKGLNQATSLLRTFVLNSIILSTLGSVGMSVMAVCLNALSITNIFIGGTSETVLPIVSTLYGERDFTGIRATIKSAFRILGLACVVVTGFFLLFPEMVGHWFGLSAANEMDVLRPALRLYALSLPFYAFNQLMQNFYTTTGREKLASAMAVLDGFVFAVGFAFLLAQINGQLLWLCYFCAELATIGVVLLAGYFLRKKEPASLLLLLCEQKEGKVWDITIPATVSAATDISEQVIRFCAGNGVSSGLGNQLGLAVEEMAANTALHGGKSTYIDISVSILEDALIVSLRDDGMPFDPTAYPVDEQVPYAVGGMQVIRRMACRISCSHQLGFNTTQIVFNRA